MLSHGWAGFEAMSLDAYAIAIVTKLTQTKILLQDLIVVASLVSTLTDAFGSASDLYRKFKRSDEEQEPNNYAPMRRRRDRSFDRDRNHHTHIHWSAGRKDDDFSDSKEELVCTSSSQVRAEYERGYRKLGEPYAQGDCTHAMFPSHHLCHS
jgi:hypothetical protein